MKTCDNCWSKIPDNATVCPKCGATQPEVPTTGNTGGVSEGSYGGYGGSGDSRILWRAMAATSGAVLLIISLFTWVWNGHGGGTGFTGIIIPALYTFFFFIPSVFLLSAAPRAMSVAGIVLWLFALLMVASSDPIVLIAVLSIIVGLIQIALVVLVKGRFRTALLVLVALNFVVGLITSFHVGGFVLTVFQQLLSIVFVSLYLINLGSIAERRDY